MASIEVGSELQSSIQAAVQPKLMENGWVVEENDTTLSEYVTMMMVNGKDLQGVQSELGGDLLGVGADDPAVGEFTRWLFDTVRSLAAPQQQSEVPQQDQPQQIPTVEDSHMDDTPVSADAPPTGPRSMRNGSSQRGPRGGRMLGQMNRQMDRSTDLPDNLRRIKGAAGQSGRINAHANRDGPPRGPKTAGLQRMMNGRGGHQGNMNAMNQMMNGAQNVNPQAQMQFMQLMEMSAQMMAQALQNGGQLPGGNNFQRGGARGGRGQRGNRPQQPPRKELHAVDGKLPDGPLIDTKGSGMDIDGDESKNDKFSTMCRFNQNCTNPSCGFAHQSPAAPPNTPVNMEAICNFGPACTNHKCAGRHPSPAQRGQHAQEVMCKFFPNCTNGPRCPFMHPTEKPCRFGGDCTVPNCKFAHSTIACRYNPCTKYECPFKHAEGQKRGKFEDKVWTPNEGGNEAGKASRFADFSKQDEGQEELIIPGQQNGENGHQEENNDTSASQMETQIPT